MWFVVCGLCILTYSSIARSTPLSSTYMLLLQVHSGLCLDVRYRYDLRVLSGPGTDHVLAHLADGVPRVV